jgi:hypothetical protein
MIIKVDMKIIRKEAEANYFKVLSAHLRVKGNPIDQCRR